MAREKDEIIREAKELQKELNKLLKDENTLTEKQIERKKELIDAQKSLRTELKKTIQERLDEYKKEEQSIANISSEFGELKKSQTEVLSLATSMNNLSAEQLEAISIIQEANREISKLSIEEVQSRVALTNQYNDAMDTLKESLHGNSKLIQSLKQQNVLANEFANKTEDENTELEESNKLLDFLKDKFGAVLGILQTITSGPLGALGVALVGIGKSLSAIGENVREFGGTMGGAVYSTTLLGTVFKSANDVARGLAREFGGMEDISFATQLNTNLMATNMGIGGEEAAKTLGIFSRLNGNSKDTAFNLASSTAELARASGLNTAQVMDDVASNAEAFALYSSDGGKSLGLASIQAAKLGVNLDSMTKVADSLLDFETSITKELELGAMLGRNINLNKARGLVYDGKIGAAVKETIKELGGIQAFNDMDVFARRESAALLGLSVEELQKMAANMDNIDDLGNVQVSQFSRMKESLMAIVSGPLGSFVQGLGGAVLAAAQMGGSFAQMGFDVKGMMSKIPIIGKLFGGGKTPGTTPSPTIPTTPTVETPQIKGPSMGDKLTDLAKGLTAMGTPQVLFGAFNLIPTGIGLATMLIGLPTLFFLSKIDLVKVGLGLSELAIALGFMGNGAVTLGALNLGLAGIGFGLMSSGIIAIPLIAYLGVPLGAGLSAIAAGLVALGNPAVATFAAIGVAILLGLSLAMIGLGFALKLTAPFLQAIGGVILNVFQGISTVIGAVSAGIGTLIEGITMDKVFAVGALALAFYGLAGSLMFLGAAGIFALPALLGIAVASSGLALVAELFGIGGESGETTGIEAGSLSEYESTMLEKMDSLISAVTSNKDVYLDKDKVTSMIMAKSDRSIVNKLNIFNS